MSGLMGMGSGSGSGSGMMVAEVEEFNCLVDHLLSDSKVSNNTHWSIRDNLHYSTPVVAAIAILFFVLAFFWNLFIIVTFFVKFHLLKDPGNIFLLNLAITDFLISVLVILFSVVTEIAQEFVFGETDVVRCNVCATAGVFLMLLVQLSIHTLAMLSIDRFIHLTRPFRYDKMMKPSRAWVILIVIWILCLGIAILPLVGFGQIEFNRNFGACLFRFTGDNADSGIPNFYYTMFVVFWDLVPIAILVSTNVYTYKFISKFLKRNFTRRSTYRRRDAAAANQKDDQKYHHQQRQLVKVFSALFVANIVSWTPVIVVVLLIIFIPADSLPDEIYTIGWLCYLTNPVLHPILESLFVKELRYQVVRAKKSVRRASSALYHSSTAAFRSKALEDANKAMEEKTDRIPSRSIHFFSERNDSKVLSESRVDTDDTDASILDHTPNPKGADDASKPRPKRRITFSDDRPGIDNLRTEYWQEKERESAERDGGGKGGETELEVLFHGQTEVLSNGAPVARHAQIEIDVHEDSSASATDPDIAVILSPDGDVRL